MLLLLLITATAVALSSSAFAASCESLSSLKLPDTTITSAQSVAAGGFEAPGGMPGAPAIKDLPAFCRVIMELKPAKDSDIKMEVWLPGSGWNGKYQGVGNGGFAGSITYAGLANAIKAGYAAASTDTGHTGGPTDAKWALGHPDKIVDFGYRAIHDMTLKAKAIVKAFYGDDPKHSYFGSCSNGGRQALMEAQRYPEDYDGIIAGAPANYWTHLLAAGAWDTQATMADPASYIPAAKIPALSAAVLKACDAEDGVTDGIVNDPRDCRFDPATMACKDDDSENCLTAPQVTALKKLYAGPKNSKGEKIFPGRITGGEEGPGGWPTWITGSAPGGSLMYAFTTGFFSDMVFDDPKWDFMTFNFDSGLKLADEKQAKNLNATSPDMKAFKARGGKLIIYHGWSDGAISALNTIDYYNSVSAAMGANQTEQFVRVFMVPGMQHCFGGPGVNSFGQLGPGGPQADAQRNIYSALEQWVEKGIAPDKLIATGRGGKLTRPLCAFPKTAKFKGTGDTNDETNFTCAAKK
ncbi:MAG TPA: tannase/feruloyl esterase family alpha/beta hydrolase [Candidatus Angelobacter sp.]|nr:tannase/feruloyl esterase family alpha/beta hydrolase [Candidatus Angelobacter sp.]